MADTEMIHRKLGNRKRSIDKDNKTPKRQRKESNTTATTAWIQNSFVNPEGKLSSGSKAQWQLAKQAPPPVSDQIDGDEFSILSSPGRKGSALKLTSTPVSKKFSKGLPNSPGFNDSDTIFATIDLNSQQDNSPRRSSRRTPSVYRRPTGYSGPDKKPASTAKRTPAKGRRQRQPSNDSFYSLKQTQDLLCESEDSLFSGSCTDFDQSLVEPTPHKQSNDGSNTHALVSTQYESQCEPEKAVFTQKDSQRLVTESQICTESQVSPNLDSSCIVVSQKKLLYNSQLSSGDESQVCDDTKDADAIPLAADASFEGAVDQDNDCLLVDLPKENRPVKDLPNGNQKEPQLTASSVAPDTIDQSEKLAKPVEKSVKTATFYGKPGSRMAQLRAKNLEKVLKEVEEERLKGSEFDIGPFYGLPSKVPEILARERKITSLYKWQHECLTLDAVRERRNLIYSLPTSGGKTLVAEILMFHELLCKKKDAIIILPFVAIVQEKVKTLSPFALDLDFVVEEYAASKGQIPPRKKQKRKSIFIATIEKASSLINSLIENERLSEIGMVVVDELHMLGEGGSRGAILEMTLAKLMHASSETQIIGMSATLSNIRDLCEFLNADIYSNNFRPVELTEYVKIEDTIFEVKPNCLVPEERLQFSRVVTFPYDRERKRLDPDHLAGLVQEVIPQHSCLVFCPTKKNCENVAELLCKSFPRQMMQVKKEERRVLLQNLWQEGSGEICPILRRTVHYGVAYHHSGLTMDERRLIEEAYLEGVLCLLTCTSTLAAGVNLPAKRVILRSPYVAMNFLMRSQYKQMVGRAGRAGLDSTGESILVLQKRDKAKLLNLVSGPCDICNSSLVYDQYKGIRSLLLTTVGLKITPTLQSVASFLQKTLCYIQRERLGVDIMAVAQASLQQLLDLDLIEQTVETFSSQAETFSQQQYSLDVTKLGRAVFKGSIDIDRGPQLYADLRQAQESLVVANYLHLLYLVTPYDMVGNVKPDWMTYLDQISCMEGDELRVLNLIGIPESYIAKRAAGQRYNKSVNEYVVNRFYITIILYNLWKQQTIWDVSMRFQVPRGLIQNILNGASTFASCTAHFCQELEEFWAYQDLFTNFVKKLSFCFMMDLIPLLEIPGVKTGRARQLYKAGFKNLQQVAHSEVKTLTDAIENLPEKVAQTIITAAKVLLTERIDALQEEAEGMKVANALNDVPPTVLVENLPKFDSQDSSQSSLPANI